MKKFIFGLLSTLLFTACNAACIMGDKFSVDKVGHTVGTAAIVFAVDAGIKKVAPETFDEYPYLGLVAGVAAGYARERWKINNGYSCEYMSMAYDLAGLGLGYYATKKWLVQPVVKPGYVGLHLNRDF